MPLMNMRAKTPRFWAIQATLENFIDLEALVGSFAEICVRTVSIGTRHYLILANGIDTPDRGSYPAIELVASEGDYFVWRDGDLRESLHRVPGEEFENRFEDIEVRDSYPTYQDGRRIS